METAAAEALLNVHPVNTNAKGLIHSIVPTDSGIPENTVPTAVILRQDNAKAVPAEAEVLRNVTTVTINVKALLPTNALTALGNGIKTAQTAAILQPANATVLNYATPAHFGVLKIKYLNAIPAAQNLKPKKLAQHNTDVAPLAWEEILYVLHVLQKSAVQHCHQQISLKSAGHSIIVAVAAKLHR